jgi:hypothetical protein
MAEPHDTRREFGAVPIVLVVFSVGLIVVVGIWLGPWGAVIVTVGFALLAIAALTIWPTRRARLGEAPRVRTIEDGRYRVLVIADERCAAPSFAEELKADAGGRPLSVFVMSPALQSRAGQLAGDQRAYDDASRRLNQILEGLRRADMEAGGEIGPHDPLQAADDGLRQFPANEIVFVTHPDDEESWAERGVVGNARSRYSQPVKHITVDG